ncbi:tetratricopeptide repeat protein [Yoonia sp. F2084L]|uniref:tetratricopeptide repeat protein n=1 Tax=Yoonia sp. F2084L TaxID=2926419 RepID=UPI001FF12207|nr:tetratricopeptide repeat protein [Yoonia sp. F2084L]
MLKRSFFGALAALAIAGAGPVSADPDAGSYLAARQAGIANDFTQASRYFSKGLIADPGNAYLLENAMVSFIALGQFERAIPVAQSIVDRGYESQVANLTLKVADAKTGNWAGIFTALEMGRSVGPLVDGLSQGWAHLGQGDMSAAIASFDQAIETEGMTIYALTHKAYALASVGDFEGAEAIFSGQVPGGMRYSRQSAIAHAQILSQLGRNADAIAIIDGVFGTQLDPAVTQLRDQMAADAAVAYSAVRTPEQGLADLFHLIAGIVEDEAPAQFTLIYARAATHLWPEHTPAVLMTARLLEEVGQYDLANTAYASVPRDDPSFHAAELGRAEVLRDAGRSDAAIEVLEALTRSHPELPQVYVTKGDTLRQADRYDEAITTYTRALALYDEDASARWFVHYTRGISYHKVDNWPGAEADFRAALALRPDHPQVLNYLGYSLVERGEKLDEALEMIETAAAARPDNGAIVDSLGWVYFQLGRYDEAVVHLERAASLEPVDPVINDHLGDALWAVGREIEAQFQWQRALSFDPEADEALRIRDKLQRGLDLVLVDEGLAPIRIASGDD